MSKRGPLIYNAEQVAGLLGLAAVTVRAIAARRKLGRRLSERVLLFSEADVDAMRRRNPPGRPKIARKLPRKPLDKP